MPYIVNITEARGWNPVPDPGCAEPGYAEQAMGDAVDNAIKTGEVTAGTVVCIKELIRRRRAPNMPVILALAIYYALAAKNVEVVVKLLELCDSADIDSIKEEKRKIVINGGLTTKLTAALKYLTISSEVSKGWEEANKLVSEWDRLKSPAMKLILQNAIKVVSDDFLTYMVEKVRVPPQT